MTCEDALQDDWEADATGMTAAPGHTPDRRPYPVGPPRRAAF
jgi:hypothetical protein